MMSGDGDGMAARAGKIPCRIFVWCMRVGMMEKQENGELTETKQLYSEASSIALDIVTGEFRQNNRYSRSPITPSFMCLDLRRNV